MKRAIYLIAYIILIITALSMLFPFFAMIILAFTSNDAIFSNSNSLFSLKITTENFNHVFSNLPITKYFFNSLFVALFTTLGQVSIASLAGFACSRLNFKYKSFWFTVIIITMMVPPQVNIIPLFFLIKELHLINTYFAMILPGLFGGFGVFLMKQYFDSLPKELEDAAKIDGCNIFQIFFKVDLPLALPACVTLAIFTFVTTWNSFMWPLIVTNTDSMRTLPVALAAFKGSFREITLWGDLLACSVVCTIPVILIFLAGKKYFLQNLLAGGVKE